MPFYSFRVNIKARNPCLCHKKNAATLQHCNAISLSVSQQTKNSG